MATSTPADKHVTIMVPAADMTIVTIHDEGTRQALESALWNRAGNALYQGDMTEALLDLGVRATRRLDVGYPDNPDDLYMVFHEGTQMLNELEEVIHRVRIAKLGAKVEAGLISSEDLAASLRRVTEMIDDYDAGFAETVEERDFIAQTRDGAVRLLVDLGTVEEVA